jgi:hypothetical protein
MALGGLGAVQGGVKAQRFPLGGFAQGIGLG